MISRNWIVCLTAAAGLIWAPAVLAEGWYLAGDIGGSRIDVSSGEIEQAFLVDDGFVASDVSLDKADFGWKASLGYRINELLAMELGYVDLGEATFDTTIVQAPAGSVRTPPFPIRAKATADGPQLSAVGHVPLPGPFSVLARVGALRWKAKFTERIPDASITRVSINDDDIDLMYGVGVDLALNETLGARVEWERFRDVGRGIGGRGGRDVDFFSAGLVFRF